MRQSMFLAALCAPFFLTGCTSLESLSLADATAAPREVSSLSAERRSIGANAIMAPKAQPRSVRQIQSLPEPDTVRIAGDRGGYVIAYAMQMMKWREEGTRLRFSGRCESACTLYLALPPEQMCLTPTASFHFHLPIMRGRRNVRVAEHYMLTTYPAWVNSWIRSRGGLSGRMIAMDYDYARKFISDCAPATSADLRLASLSRP